jgi:hypothetical protein
MKAFRMYASYNLLGKLLSPYHLHVYMNLCMYLLYVLYITRPCCLPSTPSHSALNQQTPEIEHNIKYSCVAYFAFA